MQNNTTNEISRIYDLEEKGYKDCKKLLSNYIHLIQDIINLYDYFTKFKAIKPKNKTISGEILAELILAYNSLLFNCHFRFISSCFAGLRGHFFDSLMITRIAIESCAYVYRIKTCPQLAEVWINANISNQKYKEFRKMFQTRYLFPSAHPIMNELYKRYDDCSKMAHANIISLASKLKPQIEKESLSLELDFFEYDRVDADNVIKWFFYIIDTHIGILQVFDEILKDIIEYDRKKWLINLNRLKNDSSTLFKKHLKTNT